MLPIFSRAAPYTFLHRLSERFSGSRSRSFSCSSTGSSSGSGSLFLTRRDPIRLFVAEGMVDTSSSLSEMSIGSASGEAREPWPEDYFPGFDFFLVTAAAVDELRLEVKESLACFS